MKKYRENNKEKINKHIKEYYQEHKEKKQEINKRYYEKHKDNFTTITSLKKERQDLINYLDGMLDGTVNDLFVVTSVKELLERIESGYYE